ncbi:MAG: MFS transporter, partial [Acidobacteria bacterium]|nr:MFS transporter [Acidobacteriota bacterium]
MKTESSSSPHESSGSPPDSRPESLRRRYLGLLKNNANFRRLWLAQFVSEIGDWFYSLAVYDLLFQLTGSGAYVSGAIIVQMLPWFLMIPLAGIVTDRFSRRRVMIVADLFRAVIVLGLLTVNTREEIWLIYVLLLLEVCFAALFEPARNGLLPDLLKKKDLLPANAIASATWSLNLALGAATGGLVAAVFGRKITVLLTSASFIASAAFLRRIVARETHLASAAVAEQQVSNSPQRWTDSMREVFHYLRQHKP